MVNLIFSGFSEKAIVRLLEVSGRTVSEFNMGKSASMGTIQIKFTEFYSEDSNKIQSERFCAVYVFL